MFSFSYSRVLLALLVGFSLLVFSTGVALAHSLKVFARTDGEQISGYAFFVGGGRPVGAEWVATAAGKAVAEGQTGAEGEYAFAVPNTVSDDIVITVDVKDGHIASTRVDADRFLSQTSGKQQALTAETSATDASTAETSSKESTLPETSSPEARSTEVTQHSTSLADGKQQGALPPESGQQDARAGVSQSAAFKKTLQNTLTEADQRAIERAVERQINPLLERLEVMDARLRYTDVLAGIFLIIGLAGIGLWILSRRR